MTSESVVSTAKQSVEALGARAPRYAVVMPYSSNLDADGKPVLTFYSRGTMLAAYSLYKKGEVQKLVLCGEHTFGRKGPSTSELMREQLLDWDVPFDDIVTVPGEELNNTPMQLSAVANQQQRGILGNQSLLVVAWGYHEGRVNDHLKGFGVKAQTVLVDSFLKEQGVDDATIHAVQAPFRSEEVLLRGISHVLDSRGKLTTAITQLVGPRVVDCFLKGDGTFDFVDTTAEKVWQARRRPR